MPSAPARRAARRAVRPLRHRCAPFSRPAGLAAWLLALVALRALTGCGRSCQQDALSEGEWLTVAVTPWPGSLPVYVAQEQGYFEAEDLHVTLRDVPSGHLGLEAVLQGTAAFATAGDTPIAWAAVERQPVAVVATVAAVDRPIRIVARRDRGIAAAGDLQGRRIGLVRGTTADFFLHVYLGVSGIDPAAVRVVDLAPEEVVAALVDGRVDAVSTWSPHALALADTLGENGVSLSDPSLYRMTWNLVSRQDLVSAHPERVQRLLRALARATAFVAGNPSAARGAGAARCGLDPSVLEREWGDYAYAVGLDQGLILNLEDQARWMSRGRPGSPQTLPNVLDVVHAGALKAVRPEAVRIAGR
ncbi:MAG: NrtA/SsuA/CpmA family ABC transporter substrate-binding protein [Candidatus Latescibacterota bacterium]